jgi:Ca-activated chloride channel homolog
LRGGGIRTLRIAGFAPALFCATCLFAFPHSGQTDATPQAAPLRSSTEIVKIDVSVIDSHGQFTGGLQQSDFRVLDDGVEQPLVFFAPEADPARILVLVETGPAVYLIHDEHLSALYALADGLAPGDQIALAAFDQTPRLLLPFTGDRASILSAVDSLQYSIGMGDLHFYDAVSSALDWMDAAPGKKSLLTLATGLDTTPPANWNRLRERLAREDAVVFAVALGESLRGGPTKKPKSAASKNSPLTAATEEKTPFQKADEALHTLATATGGKAYFPRTAADFAPIYREIASALRHQYVLGIRAAGDGEFHHLNVQLAAEKPQVKDAHRIFAREGYLAPAP